MVLTLRVRPMTPGNDIRLRDRFSFRERQLTVLGRCVWGCWDINRRCDQAVHGSYVDDASPSFPNPQVPAIVQS